MIATHLSATRKVQDQADYPTYKCTCHWCLEWKRLYAEVLPADLRSQLKRIGILLDRPSELYKYNSDEAADNVRVVYSLVGRVMNGPAIWIQDPETGTTYRTYHTLETSPFLSLAVHRAEELDFPFPRVHDPKDGHYLLADFRLAIPFANSEA